MGTIHPAVVAYVAHLLRAVERVLREDLVATYLHGSAAMGAFVPSRSDVDVIVVARAPLSSDVKRRLADGLSERRLPCPGVGLELSVVTLGSLRRPTDPPDFELHVSTSDGRVVDGADHEGDRDLVAHFAMTRARGVAVTGPPPTAILPPTVRDRLLRSFTQDIDWAIEHRYGGYAVLNACRALRYAREGVLSSKFEGASWAMERDIGDRAIIETAVRRQ